MSSILKALKKLESEKSQRDQLSTAVASDILRSSRQGRVRSISLIITVLIVAVVLIALSGYFFATYLFEAEQAKSVVAAPQVVRLPDAPAANRDVALLKSDVAANLPELSGIVYQEGADNRLAIINDLPVMEGTLVEGFLIKSIFPHKVVISRDGVSYDLRLREN